MGNDTFPNLYDALIYERIFISKYLERQIYERVLKSEPSVVKLIDNKSDLSAKLSTLSEPSIVKFIERFIKANTYQSQLYIILKNVLVNLVEFILFMQSHVPLRPGKFYVVVLVMWSNGSDA